MFLFRLARELGMTVGRLLAELEQYGGTDELIEQMAYARIEPFGYELENLRMGIVAATVANVAPRGKGAKPLKPSDFFPRLAGSQGLTARQRRELAARRQAHARATTKPKAP